MSLNSLISPRARFLTYWMWATATVALGFLAVGCAGLGSTTPPPTALPNSEPAAGSLPTLAPQGTAAASTLSPETRVILLPRLAIVTPAENLPLYNRQDWNHWTDEDGDCQNARAEVLIAESLVPVTFTSERRCSVTGGRWISPYTGTIVEVARELDIDHMVPLANAHRSGGWAWTSQRKEVYANNLSFEGHLIAVTAAANRSKGAKGPEEWRPADEGYWCEYSINWITVKANWDLTATADEWAALVGILESCPFEVALEEGSEPGEGGSTTPTRESGTDRGVVGWVLSG